MKKVFEVESSKESKRHMLMWDLMYAEYGELSSLLITLYEEEKLDDIKILLDEKEIYPVKEDSEEESDAE